MTRWQDRGHCNRRTYIDWVAVAGTEAAAECRGICAGCPVLDECLAHAIEHDEVGMWAGSDEHERRALVVAQGGQLVEVEHKASRSCYVHGCQEPQCLAAHTAYIAGRREEQRLLAAGADAGVILARRNPDQLDLFAA